MKSSKIKTLSTGVIFLCAAGLITGCGSESEDATTESKEVTSESIQDVETIIEPITSVDDIEEADTFGDLDFDFDLDEETDTVEGVADDLSDSATDAIDAAGDEIAETTDTIIDIIEDTTTSAQDGISDLQNTVTEEVETTIVEPVVEAIEDAEEIVAATPDLIRNVQKALADAGYNPGPADGISGPRTLTALNNFQQDNNLASGELTKETLRALGVDF